MLELYSYWTYRFALSPPTLETPPEAPGAAETVTVRAPNDVGLPVVAKVRMIGHVPLPCIPPVAEHSLKLTPSELPVVICWLKVKPLVPVQVSMTLEFKPAGA
jgi:hypothetical protein